MTGPWIAAYAGLWLVVVAVAALTLGVLRRIGAVLEAAEQALASTPAAGPGGLEPGAHVPDFRAQRLDGGTFSEEDLPDGGAVIVFLSSDCPPCRSLAREIARRPPAELPFFLVVESEEEAAELGLDLADRVLVQPSRELSVAFRTSATPHAFVVDRDGVILANKTPNTVEGLRKLARPILRGGDAAEKDTEAVVSV